MLKQVSTKHLTKPEPIIGRMFKKNYTEEDIIKGCQKGKRKMQELLYQQYAGKIMGICIRYARDPDEAQDVLQEAFIKIYEKIGQVKEPKALPGWVKRIAVNTAINHYHKQKRIYQQSDLEEVKELTGEEENVIAAMSNQELLEVIAQLPEGYRMVFNLYVIEGYPHKEIADMLQISEGTSKSQLSKTKNMLKRLVNELNETSYERKVG